MSNACHDEESKISRPDVAFDTVIDSFTENIADSLASSFSSCSFKCGFFFDSIAAKRAQRFDFTPMD